MSDQPLRAAQHLAKVVVAAQLEDPVDLGEGEDGEDLVVDVGELDGELLGGEEAVAGDAHQDERRLVQEGDDGVRGSDGADRVARINHVGHQSLGKRTRLKQSSGFGFVFNFITASGSGTVFRIKEASLKKKLKISCFVRARRAAGFFLEPELKALYRGLRK